MLTIKPIESIQIGKIQVCMIIDRETDFKQSLFEDIEKYPEKLALLPNGQAFGVVRSFLVRTADRCALIDTGYGTAAGGQTVQILQKAGVKPEDISDVLLTHLDGDHIGGMVEAGKPIFPNATVRLSHAEYEAWIEKGVGRAPQSIEKARSTLVLYQDRIETFEFDSQILPGVTARDACGHTMGHTRYDLDSEGHALSIVGDIFHAYPLQLRFTDQSSAYDNDPIKAANVRESMLKEFSQNDRFVCGTHVHPWGKVMRSPKGGYDFESQ